MNRDVLPYAYFTTNLKIAQKLNVKSMGKIGVLQPEKYWSKFEPKMAVIDEVRFFFILKQFIDNFSL